MVRPFFAVSLGFAATMTGIGEKVFSEFWWWGRSDFIYCFDGRRCFLDRFYRRCLVRPFFAVSLGFGATMTGIGEKVFSEFWWWGRSDFIYCFDGGMARQQNHENGSEGRIDGVGLI